MCNFDGHESTFRLKKNLEFSILILTSHENLNPDGTLQVLTRIDEGMSVLTSYNQLNHSGEQVFLQALNYIIIFFFCLY
jgi:hypothetical protein